MNDALKISKKAFTIAVATATILWMAGFAALVAPTANAYSAGDLIMGETLSTVYYYASDGSRYTFPNEKTYLTWYEDFSDVVQITDEELADIPLAGNIVYRPGSRWIKIQSSEKTYAVTPNGVIRWIETEDVAVGLAGDDWNQFIDDVPDVYFADYTEGASLMDASEAYDGALVSGSTYLIWDGEKRLVTDDGMTANRFQDRFLLDGEGIELDTMPSGDDVTEYEATVSDTAQLGEEVTGGLEVSLASDTAASATIPAGASAVPMLSFDVTATTGTADITGLVLSLIGVGDTANIDNVYIYDGNTRLTNGRNVNSSTREATFTSLDISLDSGETKTLTARVDVNANPTGGDTAGLEISSASDVTSTATVSGSFPVAGNEFTFSETDAGTLTIEKTGSISNPTLGENEATIAKFKLTADDESADVEQIALTIDKAADHSNFQLWQSGEVVATDSVLGDLVTFVFTDPFHLDEGESKNFYVTADIGGDAGDEVTAALDETTDIIAIGGSFGFNLAVENGDYDETGSQCAGTGDDCSYSEIQGGQLTFAFNGPSAGDIAVDANEQVLMDFAITSSQAVTIKNIEVEVYADDDDDSDTTDGTDDAGADTDGLVNSTSGDANLADIKIINSETGATVSGPMELSTTGSDAVQALDFDDQFDMSAGETLDLSVIADVDNDCPANETFAVVLDMSEVEAEDINGDALSNTDDIVPVSDITGYDQTSTTSSLTVDLTTPPGSGTYVKGTSDVDFVAFAFEAGDASDITVTDATLTAVTDDATGGAFDDLVNVEEKISSCAIYDSESGAMIDGPESFGTDAEIDFVNFGWDIPAGEIKKMVVTCNLANVDPDSGNDDAIAIEIADAADLTANDEDGDDVDATLTAPVNDEDVFQTITDSGDLTVDVSGSMPSADIILGASTGIEISVFKFDASDEAFDVNKVTFRNCITDTADADGDCADAGETEGEDDVASSVMVSYENEAGDTETKTSFLVDGYVTFDNMDFYVPTDETRELTVIIDTNSVSATTASSGDQIQLNFDAEDSGPTAEFEAVGADSGNTLDESDIDDYELGNTMEIRKTRPTVSLASGSPSGAGIPGLGEVFRFNVSADSRGYVTIDEFTFAMTATDNGGSNWNVCDDDGSVPGIGDDELSLYDLDDPSDELEGADTNWVFLASDLSVCTQDTDDIAYIILDLDTPIEIAAGDTSTFSLEMDTTGASSSNDDSIRIDLPKDSTVATNGGTDPDGTIIWDDDTEGTDIDGTYVDSLPVNGGTIVY